MTKILVLNPMTSASGNVVRDVLYGCWCAGKRIGGASVPPFPLVQIATMLRQAGLDATFIDAQAEQLDLAAVLARAGQPDVVVCSTSTMSFTEDAGYLARMKQAVPGLRSIVFGSHPTFMPAFCLAHPGVDAIALYEPEHGVLELCQAWERGDQGMDVPGTGQRGPDGEPHLAPRRPFLEELDSLPYPDVDLLPKGVDYFNPIVRRLPYMTATTSRGCPGRCTFCTAPVFDGKKVRFQSADHVVGLVKYLLSKGYREIYFRDDTFFVHKERDREICQRIIAQRLDVTWIANARVSMIDAPTMELAKKAGCHTIKFGIESGDQAILDGMKKGYQVEEAHEVFAAAKRIGIAAHAHVMIGNPGDSEESIERTIDYVIKLDPATATFGICTPYPGTPLFEEVAARHPEIRDGSATDLSRLHVEGLFNELYCSVPKDRLPGLVRHAYRRFYLRPGYMLRLVREQMRSVEDVKRILLSGTRVLDFIFRGA